MPLNLESLSDAAKAALLARIAYTFTICARDTYEVGTENVIEAQTLRAYNELLHHVTGSVVSQLSGSQGYSFEPVIEMIRSFGNNYGRVAKMDWALRYALPGTAKEPKE